MPNWCYCKTVFYGSKEDLKKLALKLAVGLAPDATSLDGGDFGDKWLGHFYGCHGYTDEQIKSEAIQCRGEILDINLEELDSSRPAIIMEYETAWGPMYGSIDKLLAKEYTDLHQVTRYEEPGMGICGHTDIDHLFFDDMFYVEVCIDDEKKYLEEIYDYTEEGEKKLIKDLEEFLGVTFAHKDEGSFGNRPKLKEEIAEIVDNADGYYNISISKYEE